jgi:WhiB family redox-sensing transcriptional regulator
VIDLSGGSCRTTDPEIFFQDEVTAKLICRECPVRAACLDWALEHNETGVWGATTELERYRLKTGWRPPPKPPVVIPPAGHGMACYRKGCRCDVGRAANAEAQRRYQATNRPRPRCLNCLANLAGTGRLKYCSARCRRIYAETRVAS